METTRQIEHFDVLIVGAGLSGIGAGFHLQQKCPGNSYMFPLGYSFKPWTEAKAIADGPRILNYVRETAIGNGIDKKIRFHHRVRRASWSSPEAAWRGVAGGTLDRGG